MGIRHDITCPLCGNYPETNDHSFFECVYSNICLKDTLDWLKTKLSKIGLVEIWKGIARKVTGKPVEDSCGQYWLC